MADRSSIHMAEFSSDSGHSESAHTPTPSDDLEENQSDLITEQQTFRITPSRLKSRIAGGGGGQWAVQVQDGHLSYGRGKKCYQALRGVNVKVPKGAIYGLLGPSGCGKTTLLNIVVGLLKLKRGQILTFGEKPGSKNSIVPGIGVGFMPQDLSLYPVLNITETLTFFGRLYQIDTKTLKERIDFLVNFLDLPRINVQVEDLSGGQQRRVSLAVALIHQPPLLILDEPTVGVDPLLRASIWEYLVGLASKEGMSIIVTTHYIEEASQANVVGLMRQGQILAEDSPADLMSKFQESSLEKCFLKICKMNQDGICAEDLVSTPLLNTITQQDYYISGGKSDSHSHDSAFSIEYKSSNDGTKSRDPSPTSRIDIQQSLAPLTTGASQILTLFLKNFIILRRNYLIASFQLILPSTLILLMCLCIGPDPKGLDMAVVNEEYPAEWSHRYLEEIDKAVHLINYTNLESAMAAVRAGTVWGSIYIGPSFTESLVQRFEHGLYVTNQTIESSSIKIYLDMTNQQIALTIQKLLLEAFQEFAKDIMYSVGATPEVANMPVMFENPVYGTRHVTFTEFISPGVIINLTYFLTVALTVMSSIDERKSGLMDRNWIAGVTPIQVLISQLMTQSLVMLGQVAGLLTMTFAVFDIPARGPFILVVIIVLLEGIFGMSFGLLISSLVKTEVAAMYLTVGSFYPCLILSGMIWPLESQPNFLWYISIWLPQTIPTIGLRSVLSRGWGITYTVVWSSLLIQIGWTIVCLVLAAVIFRIKK